MTTNHDLEAARRPNGQFGSKLHPAPECEALPATSTPFDLTTLEEGQVRTIQAQDHAISGIGDVEVCVQDGYMAITMRHPEGTDLRDLYNWDDGSRDVTAYREAVAVAEDRLGIAAPDRVSLNDGEFTLTVHEPVNADLTLDPEDLRSWAGDFAALADPAARHEFASEVVERYEAA